MKKGKIILRVFPRKTTMTPDDDRVIINRGPLLFDETPDEVHISVLFTWDLPRAKQLKKLWERVCLNVSIGGPATGQRGEGFVSGMYMKNGYTITSRGCVNRCWFCDVWKREGNTIRELPITPGWNVLDDNLLRTSKSHLEKVFQMLAGQKRRPVFSGGLEAAALTDWHIDYLVKAKPEQMFFAYDTPDDWEPLRDAGTRLKESGFGRHEMRAYCLIGYDGDTFDKATTRLEQCLHAGFVPMAMLYRSTSDPSRDLNGLAWKALQREWARPAIIYSKMKQEKK